jgi:AraC-like DNA-binding protein
MLKKLEAGAYHGRTTHLFEREGLAIADTRFAADLNIPPHAHSNAFFCFVLNGHGTRSWPARAGGEEKMHLTLFPAEMPHANCWYGPEGHVLHVEFARAWLERLDAQAKLLDRPRDFARGSPVWVAGRLSEELQHPDDVTPLAVEGLVLELLAACARSPACITARPAPKWLEDTRTELHDRLAERISLSELARSAGVSADHLTRTFRRYHGCTIGEYLRDLRTDFARRALEHTSQSLAAIAAAAGFADQSHLTRAFRRKMGLSPAQFRAMCRTDRFGSNR